MIRQNPKTRRAFYGVPGSSATRNDMGASQKVEEEEEDDDEEEATWTTAVPSNLHLYPTPIVSGRDRSPAI